MYIIVRKIKVLLLLKLMSCFDTLCHLEKVDESEVERIVEKYRDDIEEPEISSELENWKNVYSINQAENTKNYFEQLDEILESKGLSKRPVTHNVDYQHLIQLQQLRREKRNIKKKVKSLSERLQQLSKELQETLNLL